MDLAIRVEGLRKRYGETEALAGVDLAVAAGTVCGLLGPNGAGKTTVVRILATLTQADGGRAAVAGHDVATEPARVRESIGLVGQHVALDDLLTGRQNLVMFGRLSHLDPAAARRRAAELLEQFGLGDAADRPVEGYSGGMRRRLDIAASFILTPPVLFLDEPTTGLDPRGRNEVWDAVRRLVTDGTTVLLTTQYLDEADQVANQICVLDSGRTIADGTPAELKRQVGADRLEVVVSSPEDLAPAGELLSRIAGSPVRVDSDSRQVTVLVADRVGALTATVRQFDQSGIAVEDISLRRPTLDEVFLRLTGNAGPQEPATAQSKKPIETIEPIGTTEPSGKTEPAETTEGAPA